MGRLGADTVFVNNNRYKIVNGTFGKLALIAKKKQ